MHWDDESEFSQSYDDDAFDDQEILYSHSFLMESLLLCIIPLPYLDMYHIYEILPIGGNGSTKVTYVYL